MKLFINNHWVCKCEGLNGEGFSQVTFHQWQVVTSVRTIDGSVWKADRQSLWGSEDAPLREGHNVGAQRLLWRDLADLAISHFSDSTLTHTCTCSSSKCARLQESSHTGDGLRPQQHHPTSFISRIDELQPLPLEKSPYYRHQSCWW